MRASNLCFNSTACVPASILLFPTLMLILFSIVRKDWGSSSGAGEKMKTWIKILKWFSTAWFVFAGMLIFGGMVGEWRKDGFLGVLSMYGPLNFSNSLIIAITFAPALGAIKWAEKLESRFHH